MTSQTNVNGPDRKTLASQLDRLDQILDGLSEGLADAVAGAVQEAVERVMCQAVGRAVREAVQALLVEIQTNEQLRVALAGAAPPAQGWPHPAGGVGRVLGGAWGWLVGRLAGLKAWVQRAGALGRQLRGPLWVACGAGLAVGLTAAWAGPWLAGATAWAGGLVTALSVQARRALGRVLRAAETPD
jgi:hypothetical protein